MKKPNKERLIELDFIRAIAILIILFHHLPAYCFNYYDLHFFGLQYDLSYINDINRYLSLGTFVFISGYLQQHSFHDISGFYDILKFLYRRFMRIFPLYIIALLMFQVMLKLRDIKSFIVHLIGMQVLLASPSLEPIITLWYVGLIMSYYIVFILLKKFGTTFYQTILMIILMLCIALALKWKLDVIDKRFFIYFFIFIAGMYGPKILPIIRTRPLIVITSLLCLFFSISLYEVNIYPLIANNTRFSLISAISIQIFILLNIIMISFIVTFYWFSVNITILRPKIIETISYASFCIYLFHRPFWWVMLKILHPENDLLRGLYLSVIGIPILVAISYGIQKFYDNIKACVNEHSYARLHRLL
jgi:peptidoglycan/LPS O-acetylase OafA/YrhL